MKQNLNKEASKDVIIAAAYTIDKLVKKPKNLEEAYHHANFLLTQAALSLLAYTDDEELHDAIDTILAGHHIIATRAGIRPYIYATENAYEES